MNSNQEGCFACRKHSGEISVPGGAIFEDNLIYIGHGAIREGETGTYLGAFIVEPKRHIPTWAELSDSEAQRLGLGISRISKALKESEKAEHIYVFVIGHGIPHLHVWVVPRYPGTPREYWGFNIDEWPEAPMGGDVEMAEICTRIREHFGPMPM